MLRCHGTKLHRIKPRGQEVSLLLGFLGLVLLCQFLGQFFPPTTYIVFQVFEFIPARQSSHYYKNRQIFIACAPKAPL